mmetsp:Transcript_25088/g.45202  ORF Transcript_25088/g.45202 Transcript_25088/m.45202 type:complete len:315 (+) Transcript_25088:46-990(+)
MIIFSVTKRINKAIAPKLLSWSLRLHESLTSSSPYLPLSMISPNFISMLPLAQRIVSIEVQDDYDQLLLEQKERMENNKKNDGSMSSEWNNFVNQAWNVFFEDRHAKLKAEREERAEVEAQRLWDARQLKRQRRKNQRGSAQHHQQQSMKTRDDNSNDQYDELLELGERRVKLLEKYIRPALLPTTHSSSFKDRHLFTYHNNEQSATTNNYDSFVKWIRGEYLIAKYGLIVQRAVTNHPELRDDAAGFSTVELDTTTAAEVGKGADVVVPLILPSVTTVRRAFHMQDWTRHKVPWEDHGGGGGGEGGRGGGVHI